MTLIHESVVDARMEQLIAHHDAATAREFAGDRLSRVGGLLPDRAAAALAGMHTGVDGVVLALENCGWLGWPRVCEAMRLCRSIGDWQGMAKVVDALARHDCVAVPLQRRLLDDQSAEARETLVLSVLSRVKRLEEADDRPRPRAWCVRQSILNTSPGAPPLLLQLEQILLGSDAHKQLRAVMDLADYGLRRVDARLAAFAVRLLRHFAEDCPAWALRSLVLRSFESSPKSLTVAVSATETARIVADHILAGRSEARELAVGKAVHEAFRHHHEAWVEQFVEFWVLGMDEDRNTRQPRLPHLSRASVGELTLMLFPAGLRDRRVLQRRASLLIGLVRHNQWPELGPLSLALSCLADAGLDWEWSQLEDLMRVSRKPLRGGPYLRRARKCLLAEDMDGAFRAAARAKDLFGRDATSGIAVREEDARALQEILFLVQMRLGKLRRAAQTFADLCGDQLSFSVEFTAYLRRDVMLEPLRHLAGFMMEVGSEISAIESLVYLALESRSVANQTALIGNTPGFHLTDMSYMALIKAALKEEKTEQAWHWLDEMRKNGVAVDERHLNMPLKFFTDRGDSKNTDRVLQLYAEYGTKGDVVTATARLAGLAKSERWDEVETMFDLLCTAPGKQADGSPDKIVPDAVLFDEIIRVAAEQGDAEQANYWFHRMRRYTTPTHFTHTNRIISLVRDHRAGPPDSRNVELAMATLQLLESGRGGASGGARQGATRRSGGPTHAVTARSGMAQALPYMHLMRAHARLGHPERVAEVFARVSRQPEFQDRSGGDRLPAAVHTVFMDALWEAGDGKAAVVHLHLLLQRQGRRRRAGSGDGGAGDDDVAPLQLDALAPFFENASSDVEEDTYFETAAAIQRAGGVGTTGASAAEASSRPFGERLHAAIVVGRIRRQNEGGARAWWARGVREAGAAFSPAAAVAVLRACARLPPGRAGGEAWRWFEQLAAGNAAVRADAAAWTALLQAVARSGGGGANGVGGVEEVLRRMRASGTAPSAVTYLVAMKEAAAVGDAGGLARLVEAMQQTDGLPLGVRHWTVLMEAASRSGRFDDVDAIWRRILALWGEEGDASAPDAADADNKQPLRRRRCRRVWAVPEAATSVYLDSFGFRGDVEGLERVWAWLLETAAAYTTGGGGSSVGIAENHVNSYVEALLRCGAAELAVAAALRMGRSDGWAGCVPTKKTFRTVVGGLLGGGSSSGGGASEPLATSASASATSATVLAVEFSREFRRAWPKLWHYVMQDAELRERLRTAQSVAGAAAAAVSAAGSP